MIRGIDLACRGAYLGIALFALLSHLLLLAGMTVPTWLPAPALAAAWWCASRSRWPAAADGGQLAPALGLTALVVVGTVAAALTVGALGTASRFWDGLVTWDVRTMVLTAQATLEQDYFRNPQIYAHSRDYPVLQPLMMALGNRALGGDAGRLLFPLLYLLAVGTVAGALRRVAASGRVAAVCATGFAVTPMLVNATSGGADSGYGELLLASGVLCIGAGMLTRMPIQVAAGIVIAVLGKPEGLLYGLLPVVAAFITAERRLFDAGLIGWLAAAGLLLPVQYGLNHFGAEPPLLMWLGLAGFGGIAWALRQTADRFSLTPRVRLIAVAVAVPTLLIVLPLLGQLLESVGGTLQAYFGDQQRSWQRLPRLLAIVAGLGEHSLVRMRFALAYAATFLALAMAVRRRDRDTPELAVFVALGLASTLAPFLLSPENDLDHHLRSTMSRLLLHWLGAAWLLIGLELRTDQKPSGNAPPARNSA